MNFIFLLIIPILLGGCASISMLPEDANSISFYSNEGKTGWSKYEQVEEFRGVTKKEIYAAAKNALGECGFALKRAEFESGRVIGEHGMTAHDWNVIAGIYFKENPPDGVLVKVIAEGSKDFGFSGDVTSGGWTGKIISEMRSYIKYLEDTRKRY